MNLLELHELTSKLLAAGVAPTVSVAAIVDGYPRELQDWEVVEGPYDADASPKMVAYTPRSGPMLALCPVADDFSQVLNDHVNGCTVINVGVPK